MKIECRKARHYTPFYFLEHLEGRSGKKLNAERVLTGKPYE